MRRLVLLVTCILAFGLPAQADYATGYAAFQRGDYALALQEWQPLAVQGMAVAQFNLGILYAKGLGVPQDYMMAAKWFRQAAEQDYAAAQFNLGLLYARGFGVPQDDVRAYLWFYLAARQGGRDAITGLDAIAKRMHPDQIHQAEAMVQSWRPKHAQQGHPAPSPTPEASTPMPQGLKVISSGTGFIISRQGNILTNHHVIDGCHAITGRHGQTEHTLTLIASDPQNDLALLMQGEAAKAVATFRSEPHIRSGEGVVAVGFPLRGLLASEANITTGTVSALAGVHNDVRFLQITAPIQSGNSGGPLLDQSGHVIGVVSSKLNALSIAEAIGDIPQNVNFAIKASIARDFIDRYEVQYHLGTSTWERKNADIGEQAQMFTLVVECWK
jgi:uncharacterized protein